MLAREIENSARLHTSDTVVASTSLASFGLLSQQLTLESTWYFRLLCGYIARTRCNLLGCAIDHLAVLDEALDKPVAFAIAQLATVDASFTKIVVALVTNATMEVSIRKALVTEVAEYLPEGGWGEVLHLRHEPAKLSNLVRRKPSVADRCDGIFWSELQDFWQGFRCLSSLAL